MKTKHIINLIWILLLFALTSIFLEQCSFGNHPLIVDPNYEPLCASCHGPELEGLSLGPSLLIEDLKYGNSVDSLIKGITFGFPEKGMPGFSNALSEEQIQFMALWIAEKRVNTSYDDFKINTPLKIPDQLIQTAHYAFKIEIIATGISQWPYAIEPLPDGSFLVTEKTKGMRIISSDGEISKLINGMPKVYDDSNFESTGLMHGTGWMLDVVAHPNYQENGWIYLSYGDRCEGCNEESRYIKGPVSMCKIVRGRVKDGNWVDQETIWETEIENYTFPPETTLGARMTFDANGYLFFSVGAKKYSSLPPGNMESYAGIQDLSLPYGKIYRINDDGSIPEDNPFHNDPDALKSVWTYGHRSPQGLEYNLTTEQLWSTEMGPRGGDEINFLQAGKNYGWPLYSKGMNYDGTRVDYGKDLGIEFKLEDIEQPKVDMTPSPAVSSFAFYSGDKFPKWQNNMIVGSLKAATLYRYVIDGIEVVHEEILIKDLARIRDIETGYDGYVYLLLEHRSGGQLVRLVPAIN